MLVEVAVVLDDRVAALIAAALREAIVQRLAVAAVLRAAEVERVGIDAKEPDEGIQLSHAVLQRRARQTPLVERHEVEDGARGAGAAVLDQMRFVQNDAEPGYLWGSIR